MAIFFGVLLILDCFVLFLLLIQLLISVKRYHISSSQMSKIQRLEDTPTISLCIPARNETHALEDCLGSAIASDYPKLEIIVLDDCSQDKTSQIIRSFAHDGVRFVKGETPSEGWLGKNNAYETLVKEARGDYLVFMSVDTRLEPETLSRMLAYMQTTKISMLSVLPQRPDSIRASVVLAPLRYFWQMVLPLRFNIPVATALWAIQADTLNKVGGFTQYKDYIMPENSLAKRLFESQEYRFLVADGTLPAWYEKKWQSQVDTSIRLWYPQLKKNGVLAFVTAFFHSVLFVLPLKIVLLALVGIITLKFVWILTLAIITWLIAMLLYTIYYEQTHKAGIKTTGFALLTSLLTPILGAQEAILIIISFIQYKRGKVSWKGRNVCYPVLKRID